MAIAVAACAVAASGSAEASFKVCNDTATGASVAVGFLDGAQGWTAQGWWNVASGDCATPLPGSIAGSFIYLLVDGDRLRPPASQDGGWFCTADEGFSTRNADYSDGKQQLLCEAAGLHVEQFLELPVPKPNVTFHLK